MWIEVVAVPTNDAKSVMKFLHKNIFTRFGTPRALISDKGSYFDCKVIANSLPMYGMEHKIATVYHPQENGQAKILEEVVNPSRKDWSSKLDEALWTYCTTFKTSLGMSPFKLVCGKPCHLPIELEHKAFLAIKKLNKGKLKSSWAGPFEVGHVYPHGAMNIKDVKTGLMLKINRQHLKHYWGTLLTRDK
ncbi:Pol polyprotein [Gossypium australe]|uniref:Pol polyprotein n=1 Tax=Gossypium australe TaxID=47621 RepID=A0A5B6UUW2_9ROSI|nr:Pol polyprotein [Gossypium australe]